MANAGNTGVGLCLSLLADALSGDDEDDDPGVMCWCTGRSSLCILLLFLCFYGLLLRLILSPGLLAKPVSSVLTVYACLLLSCVSILSGWFCFRFSSLFLPASSSSGCSLGRRGCGCCDEVVQPVVAAVELEEDGVGFLWQRKKEEEEKSAEIG